jgi:glutaconate CoA-transferase subunit A
VSGAPTEEAYRKVVGTDRMARLGDWSASTEEWKGLFR